MASRSRHTVDHADPLSEGLNEVFEPAAQPANTPPPPSAAKASRPPREEPDSALARELEVLPPRPHPPGIIITQALATAYAAYFDMYNAPTNAHGEIFSPIVYSSWYKTEGIYEIKFSPLRDPGQTDMKARYDPDIDDALREFFAEIYERAGKALRVLTPPHPLCEDRAYVLRSDNPFALLAPLSILVTEGDIPAMDSIFDRMAPRDAQGVDHETQEAAPAFQNDAEYQRYLGETYVTDCENHNLLSSVLSDGEEGEAFCRHMPIRTFFSQAEATLNSFLVQTSEVLPFSIPQLEALIYEQLGRTPPSDPELRRYILQ